MLLCYSQHVSEVNRVCLSFDNLFYKSLEFIIYKK